MKRDRTIYSQFCPTVPRINLMSYRLVTSSNSYWFKATADQPSGIAHTFVHIHIYIRISIEIGMYRIECSSFFVLIMHYSQQWQFIL